MEEWERAWLACAIDTEGSIIAAPSNHIRLFVSNINREFCERVASIAKCGSVGIHDKSRKHIVYVFRLFSMDDIQRILTEVLPHLIVKRELALTALRYFELRKSRKHFNDPRSEEELALLNKLRIRKHSI